MGDTTTTSPTTTMSSSADPSTTIFTPPSESIRIREPKWIDENTGEIVEDIHSKFILNTAIMNNYYEYKKAGTSLYIKPNTYYYYTGSNMEAIVNSNLVSALYIPESKRKVNRIYQEYPVERYIMLSNNFIKGTLNPKTTKAVPTKPPYPSVTIIQKALDTNNNNLYEKRFNIIDTQDTLNKLTNRINNLKLKLTTLNQKPMYSASGQLTFY